MKNKEIHAKIQDLLSSGHKSNTQIALQLISSQLNSSPEVFLETYPLHFKKKSVGSESFYLHINIGHILLQYDYIQSFAPYMGTIKKATRKMGLCFNDQTSYPPSLQISWDVKTIENSLEIKKIFERDYYGLIPDIMHRIKEYL